MGGTKKIGTRRAGGTSKIGTKRVGGTSKIGTKRVGSQRAGTKVPYLVTQDLICTDDVNA